jgi:hypothetical protein
MTSYTFERYLISKLTLTYLTLCPLPFAGPGRPSHTGHCLRASYASYGQKTGHRSEAGMAAYRRIMPDKERAVQDTALSSMLSKRPSDSSENSLSAPQPPPKVPRISTTRASMLSYI